MALVTVAEVQVWLEKSKLTLANDDALEEESTASQTVLGRLASVFDTSGWISVATTPTLVRKIIAMLVASWRYNKHYSEADDAGNPYADKLERMAMTMIDQLINGSLTLLDVTLSGPGVTGILSFYPTDQSTAIDDEVDAGIAFTMGTRF